MHVHTLSLRAAKKIAPEATTSLLKRTHRVVRRLHAITTKTPAYGQQHLVKLTLNKRRILCHLWTSCVQCVAQDDYMKHKAVLAPLACHLRRSMPPGRALVHHLAPSQS